MVAAIIVTRAIMPAVSAGMLRFFSMNCGIFNAREYNIITIRRQPGIRHGVHSLSARPRAQIGGLTDAAGNIFLVNANFEKEMFAVASL